ncbi:hypothetical protein LOC68_09540 [Blastopirellula sp. JC732]|uniref:SAF domain-containing protein n=1 Tax=Blastopirellula sediminis TaxID=2894196 RepID=A0A9X1MLV1_9BACT|nr:hypothetical protein [Blastopirellula sediminis]MCC9608583.1 hypothetical protein [Blastopirellula sediminis]MCC9628640.1 hypothetical protein [Blastopirellula sediminis]
MSHTLKFLIAVVIGIVAAGLNWFYLNSKTSPRQYVIAKADIKQGDPITDDQLDKVEIAGDKSKLDKSFIPYESREILTGQTAPRDYQQGDVFFYRDLTPPKIVTKYRELGPYRVISVGSRFSESIKQGESSAGGNEDTVTIAVKWPPEKPTLRLMDITRHGRTDDELEDKEAQIDRVLVCPPPKDAPAYTANTDVNLGLATNERAAFISLDGIDNVPRVLQIGQWIGFVVLDDASSTALEIESDSNE